MVYHYCSIDTFLKIIQNKTLRLSDIGKSNDYSERIYMENMIHEELEKKIRALKLEEKIRLGLLETEKICRDAMADSINLYGICFSEDGDLLSQWRGYANNGRGVAIGFSNDILGLVNDEKYGLMFKKVCYEEKEQREFAQKEAKIIIDTLKRKNAFASFAEVYENDIEKIGCMKQAGFAEEKEWRLCIGMSPEGRVNKKAAFREFTLSEIKTQCIGEQIVTYFDLSFEKVCNDFVREIVIGPSARVTEKEIYTSLWIHGFDAEEIDVVPSQITYR